jgi:hypothetical protein
MMGGSTRKCAVLINDTSSANHHGCRRVVATIRSSLAIRGIDIVASSPIGAAWGKDAALEAALRSAHLLVVNGEGTLHHGAPEGERLLQAVDHAAALGKPVALINTIYQDNPSDWARRAKSIALMSTRDRRSWIAAREAGFMADYAPDLSLFDSHDTPETPSRLYVAYGDSVFRDVTQELLRAYRRAEGRKLYLPIRTAVKHASTSRPLTLSQRLDNFRYGLAVRSKMFPRLDYCLPRTADEYMASLSMAELYITGRYHAVCFALMTRTPFRAIASNTYKIETLLEEAGLNPARMTTSIDVLAASPPYEWQFSPEERGNVEAFLADARREIDHLFNRVAALVQ